MSATPEPISVRLNTVLLEALQKHLSRPVKVNDLQALCDVLGVKVSEMVKKADA